MTKRISILNFETTNKIAAGEVVERPSSVVKELIENSIDAKAKNITIEILSGGIEQIKIMDDGVGIHNEDIQKAFLPHATSKILSIEDVYSLSTFGFRGEALASIASVSKIILKSKTNEIEFGKELKSEGGNISYIEDVGCNKGTSIEVRDLFFNVPARKKFLKSSSRESAIISSLIGKLALANHKISFKYFNNNKKSLITFAADDVKETIKYIYGKNIYNNLIKFENHTDVISVHGYVGNPDISRGSRNNQSIFVNKRLIKSPLITTAVENAFKSFTTVNKHPFFVLFIDIYPEYIDVNVHPTKAEIKFNNDKEIFSAVFNTIHNAIRKSVEDNFEIKPHEKEFKINESKVLYSNDEKINELKDLKDKIQIPIDLKANIIKEKEYIDAIDIGTSAKELSNKNMESNVNLDKEIHIKKTEEKPNQNGFAKPEIPNEQQEKQNESTAKFPKLKIIGQFNKTYILAEADNEFYMIDQHAAHEIILIEKFSKEMINRTLVSQPLMVPVILELSADDFYYYSDNRNVFEDTGFKIGLFGDNTISIREVPILLGKLEIKDLFYGILDNLKNYGQGNLLKVRAYILNQISCKKAIKANHALNNLEMESLIEKLRYIEQPFHCPHGRPVIIKTSLYEIEKKFKRVT
ncbi:DNA mismatch repair endonuclease MutL [Clostridium sediminicola]|uniref:DNA mismatch repair endonuclease MutL n=1 Tax=Clostridium sediminicola TaxID=3114879 RepID=UPI0031F236CC